MTNMKATLLDRRDDAIHGTCYLVKVALSDYVGALPATYKDFDIQREIVSNIYLDRLVDTVLERRHIPNIVLAASSVTTSRDTRVEVGEFNILDGLQRTFRLQAIHETIEFFIKNQLAIERCASKSAFALSRAFSEDLRKIDSNTSLMKRILSFSQAEGLSALRGSFKENYQWFEVWTDLSRQDEVSKMLTLNAGHKPVTVRHQLELLFLYLLPELRIEMGDVFTLVREKETSSAQFSKNRRVGQFHFAHIVAALLSFAAAKPIVPSAALIQRVQDDQAIVKNREAFEPDFMKEAVRFIVRLDEAIASKNSSGVRWMGREVVITGIFAAAGSYALTHSSSSQDAFRALERCIGPRPEILNLDQFESVRNNQDLSKINIGSVNRVAVFNALSDLLRGEISQIDWLKYFAGQS